MGTSYGVDGNPSGGYQSGGQTSVPTSNLPNQWGETSGGGTGTSAPGAIDQPGEATEKVISIGGSPGTAQESPEPETQDKKEDSFNQVYGIEAMKKSELQYAQQRAYIPKPGDVGYRATPENPAGEGYVTISQDSKSFTYRKISPETYDQEPRRVNTLPPALPKVFSIYPVRKQEPDIIKTKTMGTWVRAGSQYDTRKTPIDDFIKQISGYESKKSYEIKAAIPHAISDPAMAIDKTITEFFKRQEQSTYPTPLTKAGYEFGKGMITGVLDKPITSAVSLGVGYATGGLSKVSALNKPFINAGTKAGLITKVASKVTPFNIAATGMGAIYASDVATRISSSKNPARTAGEIASTELLPMSVGFKLGQKPVSDINTFMRSESASLNPESHTAKILRESMTGKAGEVKISKVSYGRTFKEPDIRGGITIQSGRQSLVSIQQPELLKSELKYTPAMRTSHKQKVAIRTKQSSAMRSYSRQSYSQYSEYKPVQIKEIQASKSRSAISPLFYSPTLYKQRTTDLLKYPQIPTQKQGSLNIQIPDIVTTQKQKIYQGSPQIAIQMPALAQKSTISPIPTIEQKPSKTSKIISGKRTRLKLPELPTIPQIPGYKKPTQEELPGFVKMTKRGRQRIINPFITIKDL